MSLNTLLMSIGLASVLLLVVFLLYVAFRPSVFSVTRSTIIPADPRSVFALVNNFHDWERWSPWAKLDPNSKVSFDGPDAGVGAKFAWNGNNKVGEGRMEITECRPHELIKFDLIFSRPMKATNVTVFTFDLEGKGTKVTWTMSGANSFFGKLFGMFVNCDKMVGDQFEQGFANMRETLTTASHL